MLLLSARMLNGVADANTFEYTDSVALSEGDSGLVYFIILDASKDRKESGFSPAGRRYIPLASATMTVTLENADPARVVSRPAMQPFMADDRSIWAFQLLPTDTIRGTVRMKIVLNEGGKTTSGVLDAAFSVRGLDGMTRC